MVNKLQLFENEEFGKLEVLMIGDKPYFPATECARIVGHMNPQRAIRSFCKGVTEIVTPSAGGNQKVNFIPEGDLYRLIIRSKLPAAERFEAWVFDEVLPSIRKHGAYIAEETLKKALESSENSRRLLESLLEEQREKNTELVPKARYCDSILRSGKTVPISVIAKDYGMPAALFNKLLHGLRVQYKVGETWLLYQPYADRGYTKTRTYHINEDTFKIQTCWTQKGRYFLYDFLKHFGVLPLTEAGETGLCSDM